MKTTERSTGAQSNIVEITTTPAALIRSRVLREVVKLENSLGLSAPQSARDTLIEHADIAELNAVYLAEREDPDLQPVIESHINLVAKIRFWLS